ncbi:MAG: signal peptidase II [bacterium]
MVLRFSDWLKFLALIVLWIVTLALLNFLYIKDSNFSVLNTNYLLGVFEIKNALIIFISLVLVIPALIYTKYLDAKYLLPMGLIIIGASSNIVSRVLYGGIYDFIPLVITKINLEDILIVCGFALLFLRLEKEDEK